MNQPWMYIVLFGLVLLVYARILPKKESYRSGEEGAMSSEMESAMDHISAELEEQNQALISMFAETRKENELQHARLLARLEAVEKHNAQLQQELSRLSFMQEQRPLAAPLTSAPPEAAVPSEPMQVTLNPEEETLLLEAGKPHGLKERYPELFRLHEEGKSTDVIAKKLGLNKGEIHLILQLAKQEDRTHA